MAPFPLGKSGDAAGFLPPQAANRSQRGCTVTVVALRFFNVKGSGLQANI
jgi:hypothetical protein